ncbi:protein kinase domain-containing protein [Dokdonella fugitiva]|uniref:protein kinase domain-containing protein n=1 Tax=Dokdonella fugitiva TaxID=328517 RepID=UPI0015FA0978|nr:winged helix-turn-helix domain-containing protein [Dokdonella fugitiva]MBA8884193.1 non-specific serine/threonine protein kinase [Dokdonella fugitiva]
MELRVDGAAVAMEPRPLQVLALLLQHAGEVVTKQELLDAVWDGRPTVEHVIATAIGKLRRAFGESDGEPIVTVPRLGYRLVAPVERVAVGRLMTSELAFRAGEAVPGRERFRFESQLGRTLGSEVWLARHDKTHEARVYKFASDATRLSALKREATLSRVLRESLGEREGFVRVIDWNFADEPFYLEEEYGGRDLVAWSADEPDLSQWTIAQRIAFFLPIADTLADAHGVGVLHKDLKPANLLVRRKNEGAWQVLLTDFGSGRLLHPERLDQLGITALGLTHTQAISPNSGTPLYLAPEVIAGGQPTVRSDVYALGLLLYQIAVGDLRKPLTSGWERDIDDALLREDIARATDGEPARRLASAADLADRLRRLPERHAEREQVAATRHGERLARQALDRARARRPWVAALVGVLALGLGIAAILYQRADAARLRAERETSRSNAIQKFLSEDLLGAADPGNAYYNGDPTIAELLRRAEARLTDRFADDPAIRGAIYEALGRAQAGFGHADLATENYRRAAAAYASAPDAANAVARVDYDEVRMLALRHDYAAADRALETADHAAGDRAAGDPDLALHAALARGMLANQRFDAKGTLREYAIADALQRKYWPEDASLALPIRSRLADGYLREGQLAAAEGVIRQQMLGDPILAEQRVGKAAIGGMRKELARVLRNQSRLEEARTEAEAAVELTKQGLGPDHFHVIDVLSVLSSIYQDLHRCEPALATAKDIVRRYDGVRPPTDQGALIETGNLGFVEYDCGHLTDAITHLGHAEAGLAAQFGAGNPAAQAFRVGLARALADAGRYDEALGKLGDASAEAVRNAEARSDADDTVDFVRGTVYVLQGRRRQEGLNILHALYERVRQRDGGSDLLPQIESFLVAHERKTSS